MKVVFGGADQPTLRRILIEAGVKSMSLNFTGLQARLPKTKAWHLGEHFPEDVALAVESGGFAANKGGMADHQAHLRSYQGFVEENIRRLSRVTEYDALDMGEAWIERQRVDYWDAFSLDKFCPIWHPEFGVQALDRLADEYSHVGIVKTQQDFTSKYNGIVARRAATLHGFGLADPELLSRLRLGSITTTSWVSPVKYGETMVWTGNVMRRYQAKAKDQARKRHRRDFEKAGFDPDAIANDDTETLYRYTIWAWLQFEEAMSRRRPEGHLSIVDEPDVATTSPEWPNPANEDPGYLPVAISLGSGGSRVPAPREDTVVFPGLSMGVVTSVDEEGATVEHPVLAASQLSLRQCSSCYISERCPGYRPNASCAYKMPIEIRTKPQLNAMLATMLEIQTQRIAFMRVNEELEGGYADPNLSNEMDRMMKMTVAVKEIQDNRDFLDIKIRAKANAGALSRIFGAKATEPLQQLAGPITSDEVMAEILEDP